MNTHPALDPDRSPATQGGGHRPVRPVLRHLLPALMVMLALLSAGVTALLSQQYRSNMQQRTAALNAEVVADFSAALDLQAAGLASVLQVIINDPRLAGSLSDAKPLLADWNPVFQRMREAHGITHFYFLDPTRHCILRLHKPERSGDLIDRFTARVAERTKALTWGIELGPLGTFTLRVVQPLIRSGRVVGYVELGKEIEDILSQLHGRTGQHLALTIDKTHLNRAGWEEGMRLLNRPADWQRLKHNAVIYASTGRLPEPFMALADHDFSDSGNAAVADAEIDFDGKIWRVSRTPVKDASGLAVGGLLVMSDITTERAAFRAMVTRGAVVGSLLLLALLGFIVMLLRRSDAGILAQQAAMRISEERLSFALQGANDGLWDWNLENNEVYYSPRWLEMLGYLPGELPASLDTWSMLVHVEDRERTLAAVTDYLDGRTEKFEVDFRMRHKQGHWIDILSRARLARDADGIPMSPRRLVGTHVDQSERKRVQLALERQVAFTRSLIDAEVDGVLVCHRIHTDPHIAFTVWNRAMTEVTGYTQGDMNRLGWCQSLFDSAALREQASWRLDCMFQGEHLLGEEWTITRKDGDTRVVRIHSTSVTSQDGDIHVLMVIHDISSLHAAQLELAGREASWRGLFNNAVEAIYILEADGRFIDVNPAAEAMYGRPRAWFVGRTPSDVSAPGRNDLARVFLSLAQAMAGEPQRFEFWGVRANAEVFLKEVYVAPSQYFGRTVIVAMARDITERLRAEERVRRSEAELRAERDLFVDGPVGVLVWRIEANWPLEYASANIGNVFGYSAERMLAPDFHYAECIHPDDLSRVVEEVSGYLADAGRKTWEQHYRILWPDGSVHSLYDFTVAERDGRGQAIRLRGYVTDETEAHETGQRLARVREQLEFAIQGSGVGLWDWRIKTGEVVLNERWAEMLGYPLHELAPISIETWVKLADPGDLARAEAAQQAHFRGETDRYVSEVRMRHKSGDWIWVLDQGRVVEWDGDDPASRKPVRMVGTHTDITRMKQLENALKHERGILKTLVRTIPDLVWLKDLHGRYLSCNPRVESCFDRAESDIVGKTDYDFLGHTQADRFHDHDCRVLESQVPVVNDEWVRFAGDGHLELLEITRTPMLNGQGQLIGVLGIGHEITERKRAEDSLRQAASVFSHAREGIMITTPDGDILDVNEAFTEITGYDRSEVLGRKPSLLNSGRQSPGFYATLWQDLLDRGHWTGEIWNRRKNGEIFAELLTISAIHDENNAVLRYVALFSDITPLKEQQHQLEHIAHYDALTGLPNRVLLGDRLHQAIAQSQRRGSVLAVAYLDLDGFKAINDSYGHESGDRVLTAISGRMKQALREVDTLARLGGDEFVAVLLDLPDPQACVPMLERLLSAAAEPVWVDNVELRVSASVGVAFFPQLDEIDPDQLLRQADQAMYQAKLAGKNRYHIFDADQDRNVRGHHESIEHIRQAMAECEFVLYYQPKVNMHTGVVIGAEALIRWRHPRRGLLAPAVFLPLIEGHPLAVDLGSWVLNTALTQIETWQAAGLDLPVSVNIDAMQLQHPEFVAQLKALLAAHPGVASGQLELEVLETSALEDIAHVSDVILACRDIGVNFALDDFGTGYSSLTYLKRLPAAQLKIDQSFVRDMLDDPEDLAILEGVLGLANAFRRGAIAEGVETLAHGEMLLRLGCEYGQGYAIAHPMPGEAIPDWLGAWRPDPSWLRQVPSSHEDLPILFGLVEHRAWVAAMVAYLTGNRDAPPALEVHQCRFGHWLARDGRNRLDGHPAYQTVMRLHEEIHERAVELLALERDHPGGQGRARVGELLSLRDLLLEHLLTMLK